MNWKRYHEGLRAAKPQPNLKKKFYHGGSGHEKTFKNHDNSKISLNEIEYLQVLIFAKTKFFLTTAEFAEFGIFLNDQFLSRRTPRLCGDYSSVTIPSDEA
jgi:hypothetical protein